DSDGTQHWEVCAVCGYVTGEKVDCTADETAYQSDRNNHWHTCVVCGGEMDKGAHDTNGDDGACSICGYVKAELATTTIYMVGDSTMCSFNDKIYIPRYGYGTQLGNYLDEKATIVNLAMSGRSSQTFLAEDNYTTLENSLNEGDYLIIGFGHNDEKSGDTFTSANLGLNQSTSDTISFQDSLKDNYIDLATEKGATPILCTPIVRYSSSGDYSGERAHITSDGDYPQAIRDLGQATGTTVIDLTATTKEDYTSNPDDVVWYHSYNSAKATEDATDPMARTIETTDSTEENKKTQTVIPSGMDSTHLNMYGAKMVSYEFVTELAKTNNELAEYIADDIEKPTMEKDFTEEIYYSEYKYRAYSAFDSTEYNSSYWTTFPSNDGMYGTVFGDIGGASKFSNFTVKYENETYTIGTTTNSGKINSSGGDGLGMAFKQVSVNDNFTATANVKVTQMGDSSVLSGQTGFGMMVRDDMYIDEYDTTITSTYVTASVIGNGSSLHANAYKVDATGSSGKSLSGSYEVGSEYTVKIQRENQTVYCTLTTSSGTTVSSTATDYNFYEIDEDYIYLCLFATRGVICEFTNFSYTYDGVAVGA
ncbi:MAG: GDSL-type esterase/lipase family protein, partial [Bacteroidales bacterium]|nr:GDSL-type esterase/lipase family protein [Bacteroidales bacterium]